MTITLSLNAFATTTTTTILYRICIFDDLQQYMCRDIINHMDALQSSFIGNLYSVFWPKTQMFRLIERYFACALSHTFVNFIYIIFENDYELLSSVCVGERERLSILLHINIKHRVHCDLHMRQTKFMFMQMTRNAMLLSLYENFLCRSLALSIAKTL